MYAVSSVVKVGIRCIVGIIGILIQMSRLYRPEDILSVFIG